MDNSIKTAFRMIGAIILIWYMTVLRICNKHITLATIPCCIAIMLVALLVIKKLTCKEAIKNF